MSITMTTTEAALAATVLSAAANLIDKHGWIQHEFGNVDCGYCLTGAIDAAAYDLNAGSFAIEDAEAILEDAEAILIADLNDPVLVSWNDDPHRTRADVVGLLNTQANLHSKES